MTSAPPPPDRLLTAASTGLLVLVLPLSFLALVAAAASLAPEPDSARSALAVLAAVPLLLAAAGLATVVALRRAAGRVRSTDPARVRLAVLLGTCAVAAPLVRTASGGESSWALSIGGAVGIVLVLLPLAARRHSAALQVAVGVAVVLVGTALVRDRPTGDLHGPPPVTSPGQGAGTPLAPAAPPR